MKRFFPFYLVFILLLRINKAADVPVHSSYSHDEDQLITVHNLANISPLTSASGSPEFSHLLSFHPDETSSNDGRPRKSSFNSHSSSRKILHVSFGWVQLSDDRWMPSDDMEDTKLNREHIKELMLIDARHGNLEYFMYLVNVLRKFNAANPQNNVAEEDDGHELDVYNHNSLILAAVHSDNVALFIEVMRFKGITLEDLNPCKIKSPKIRPEHMPGSFPPRPRSFFDSDNSSDEDEDADGNRISCVQIEETILGQVIRQNSIAILEFLLTSGIKDAYPEKTETALHYAIESEHELIVSLLLTHGNSDVNRFNGAFNTPLMTAVLTGNAHLVKLILKYDPNLLTTNFSGQNVLHLASKTGNLEILQLLKKSADKLLISQYEMDKLVLSEDVERFSVLDYAPTEQVHQFLLDHFYAVTL